MSKRKHIAVSKEIYDAVNKIRGGLTIGPKVTEILREGLYPRCPFIQKTIENMRRLDDEDRCKVYSLTSQLLKNYPPLE